MKLLFDQNLSHRLVAQHASQFPGSAHVRSLGLSTVDDLAIWEYAKAHGYTIVSKDADFHQRSFLLGHPPKVVWIRLGNCSTEDVNQMLMDREEEIRDFGAHRDAAFLVLS